MKRAPQPSSYRRPRPMSKTIHEQTFQSNNCHILTEFETNKKVKVLGFKWDAKKIQVCKDLLQGKCLMLGGAKNNIVIIITKNDEAITIEKRSSITLEDFCIVHVEVVCQLVLAKDLLKKTIKLRNQSSNVGFFKDFEGYACEMNDIAHV